MNETHDDDTLLIRPEPGVHDGCFLLTVMRCPVKVAELNARLEALPVEPEWFKVMTARMARLEKIYETKPKSTKGGEICKTTKSTTSLDQRLSMSSQPEVMTAKI